MNTVVVFRDDRMKRNSKESERVVDVEEFVSGCAGERHVRDKDGYEGKEQTDPTIGYSARVSVFTS